MSKIVTWNNEKNVLEVYERWEFISVNNLETRKKKLEQAFKTTTSNRWWN